MDSHLKYALDGVALGATAAALTKLLPPISALLSIIWLSIQIGTWLHRQIKGRTHK